MKTDFMYHFLAKLGFTHPLHPLLTHLPIALVVAALTFEIIAFMTSHDKYAQTARHCSALAFLAIFPTVILGLTDWAYFYGADWMFAIKMKMILAGVLTALMLLVVILNIKRSTRSGTVFLLYLFSFLTVTGLGYFGGELVFGKSAVEGAAAASATFGDVRDIFRNNCTSCHSGANPPNSLDLTTYDNTMKGGKNGPVVVPGQPAKSILIKRVKGISMPQMPLASPPLTESKIRILEKWVESGAPGPTDGTGDK